MTGTVTQGLNPEQRAAVVHDDGPLLILAGAGSGKTRVITHRIAHLIERGTDPASIVAMTFTNKAAKEMRERATHLVGDSAGRVLISTFHSACARWLRESARSVGLSRRFSIYDEADQLVVLQEVARRLDKPTDLGAARHFRGHVEAAKHEALRVAEVEQRAVGAEAEEIATVFAAYQAALAASNALDFGDLVSRLVHALEDDARLRSAFHARYRHVLVDEFQDTNVAQYRLLCLVAGPDADVTVVGDDDQAIYGWRGATVANVRAFCDDHVGTQTIRLEQNYRSAPTILEVAHTVVEALPGRLPKRLRTDRTDREPVRVFIGADDREEAAFVAREIERLRVAHELSNGDFAVFFRTNAQSRVFEERFRHLGIDHEVRGIVSWFDRREVKDLIAYLRLAVNPADEVAFRRIANVPARGIGKTTLRRLIAHHDASTTASFADSLTAFSARPVGRLAARTREGIEDLATLLSMLGRLHEDARPAELLETVLVETEYESYLTTDDAVTADDRLQNVRDLVASAREFEHDDDDGDVAAFLESMALATPRALTGDDPTRVQLMTIHAAKGLEFPVVFVTGVEAGQLPLRRNAGANGADADEDEERRLCYVAFTRARERLYVTAAMRRRLWGQQRDCDPSPYLLELEDAPIEIVGESSCKSLDWRRSRPQRRSRDRRAQRDPFDQRSWPERAGGDSGGWSDGDEWRVPDEGLVFDDDSPADPGDDGLIGRQAHHKTFGTGVVTGAEGRGPTARLSIDFPEVGAKKVVAQYVELVD